MQLKYINYCNAVVFAFCSMLLVSCKDLLPNDPSKIEENVAILNKSDLNQLLSATYDILRSENFMGGKVQVASEFIADNINGTLLAGDEAAYYNHNSGIFNSLSRDTWKEGYITIYRANTILEYLPKLTDLTDAERTQIEGEVKFLRAVAMFEMVRIFGHPYNYTPNNTHLGLVMRLKASPEAVDSRSTVAETYAQIINDLNTAVQKCSAANRPGYASKWSAKAYLAKVYFQMNKFQEAHHNANEVIQSGLFLLDTLNGRFASRKSKEAVFVMTSDNANTKSGKFLWEQLKSTTEAPKIKLSKSAFDAAKLESMNDLRFKNWYSQASGSSGTEYWSKKYNLYGNDGNFDNTIASLTELKLIRAECNAEMGMNQTEALTDINDIRTRAMLPITAAVTDAQIIDAARRERRVEFVIEGNRLHELKRIATATNSKSYTANLLIRNSPWNCNGMVGQIPDTETAGNPNIVKNGSGGCN
jgi:starch-binding outer membrane protein, SusD/RagB family